MENAHALLEKFKERFGTKAAIYRAPGRVNLIGEHTDYNDGFVLPAAIGFSCWVAIAPREDRKLIIYSENFGAMTEVDLDNLPTHGSGAWSDYPVGVAWAHVQAGNHPVGANSYISGEVPLGSGLSSSAAVEVSVGYAMLDIAKQSIDRTKLALLCQRAENEFVGARCGIMDQFVSCNGRAGHALLLDCRSLDFEVVKMPPNVHLVICNTMVKHELGASEYNERRAECEEGVRLLSAALPAIRALRDVNLGQLEENRKKLSETIYKRCRHVITEIERTRKAAAALQRSEIGRLSRLMADSHKSLRDDFEVSCRELDVMVEVASRQKGILGARMTGGGFGGCTINLVEATESAEFRKKVAAGYASVIGLQPDIYICEASQGAEAVDLDEVTIKK
jgi:galactokinase